MERSTASRLFALLTFTAGAVAAYLMYRREESPLSIAKNTLSPIGSLAIRDPEHNLRKSCLNFPYMAWPI